MRTFTVRGNSRIVDSKARPGVRGAPAPCDDCSMTTTQISTTAAFASESDRWAAVTRRDSSADGHFFYSVSTTGVYCRPSCPSRQARREHVRFHPTIADAERAGFRACKRCRPNEPALADQRASAVARACRLIERTETLPSLDALADAAGMSRFHFHRVFKAVTGLTPRAYAAAHRANRVREELGRRPSVTEAIYEAGYNSNGRFYAAAPGVLGMTPTRFRAGGAGESIHFAVGECSLGSVLVAATDKGVCAIMLGDDPDGLVRNLQDRFRERAPGRRRCRLRAARGEGRRTRRGARGGDRPAARRPRHGVSAAGMAGVAQDPGWINGELRGYRPPHRRAESRSRRRPGVRSEPGRDCHPVSSRRAPRWGTVRLPVGRGTEARAARS